MPRCARDADEDNLKGGLIMELDNNGWVLFFVASDGTYILSHNNMDFYELQVSPQEQGNMVL